jgi:hypothetical protein
MSTGLVDRHGRPLSSKEPRRRLVDPTTDKMARIAEWLGAEMGQTSAPLSPNSMQLNELSNSISDATGAGTFYFKNVPQGSTWTGTLSCTAAPPTAIFVANIGATPAGDWAGDSVFGPVQAFGSQQLIVTAQGLSPNTDYLMTWIGSADPAGLPGPVWPDSNSSAQTVQFGQGTRLVAPTAPALAVFLPSVTVPATVRTLILFISGPVASAQGTVQIQGNFSGFNYYNSTPYLQLSATTYMCVCPIPTVIDPTVRVFINNVTPASVALFGDNLLYKENVFYNGTMLTAVASVTGGLLNGPKRLLSISLDTNNTGSGQITMGGVQVLFANPNQSGVMTFPPDTLLSAGSSLMFVNAANAVAATATYAYP